ncbi:BAR domain-containing protein [Coemansia brasiliensis]|uniref:BAR domain-containing protein n=1 Tax=Coemansia brasiliensis TaxID=2650707 RepID=A0A9W8I6I7_9FUNG|nr:BAR domain-containing protein [Coemansia brasiliensis]
MDSFSKFTQNVSTNWTPFANKVSKGFTQYKQLASETLGSHAEKTELPQDYVALEKRYESVRQHTQVLLRLTKTYASPAAQLVDMQALQTQFSTLTSRISGKQRDASDREPAAQSEKQPMSPQHEISRASLDAAEKIGLEEPLGAALFKFGSIEEKVGAEKIKQDQCIQRGFVEPTSQMLESGIALAQNARKQVQAARLTLDANKAAFKNARPDKAQEARGEVERAEDHFVTVIEEAMNLMRSVVESPQHLKCLSELVNAQLNYHKEAAALLADLAPEIEEIQVTQEALYHHDNRTISTATDDTSNNSNNNNNA